MEGALLQRFLTWGFCQEIIMLLMFAMNYEFIYFLFEKSHIFVFEFKIIGQSCVL